MTADTTPVDPAAGCDFCSEAAAVVYCQADSASLCLHCDRHVHTANSVSSRHNRTLLCDTCRSAPAAFLCSSAHGVLCSNCDFDAHPPGSSPHDRRPVEPFTGCPSVNDLAAVLGVGWDEKEGAGDGDGGGGWPFAEDMWVWETAPVACLQDLIVPTTLGHGFQATGIPPLPKNRNPACGKHRDEIIRQLNELIKSETGDGNDGGERERERVLELTSLKPDLNFQQGNLGSDFDHDPTYVTVPSSEGCDLGWNCSEFQETTNSVVFSYEQLMESSSLLNKSSDGDIHTLPNTSHGRVDERYPVIEEKILPVQPKGELCPDRESVLSRYKQKRKTRRYDKQIRYESRKARADTRMRIKGRFAKVSQEKDS